MDVKKFFADLIATFRKPADPPPSAPVVDVDAAHEAGRNAGYEAGHAEGFQIGFEDKTQQEPPPLEQPSQPEPPAEEPQSS
jgi:hypothetical protein